MGFRDIKKSGWLEVTDCSAKFMLDVPSNSVHSPSNHRQSPLHQLSSGPHSAHVVAVLLPPQFTPSQMTCSSINKSVDKLINDLLWNWRGAQWLMKGTLIVKKHCKNCECGCAPNLLCTPLDGNWNQSSDRDKTDRHYMQKGYYGY